MPSLEAAESVLRERRVLVTGHTGSCGSWLSLWLKDIGCEVSGLALMPDTAPNLFELAGLAGAMDSTIADIRDREAVRDTVARLKPDLVFHLAAQPLVRRSYRQPVETFDTNVIGTAHVLEACRAAAVKGVVCVTTDKVYRNLEAGRALVEGDELGGHDPYSASKAAAELVIASYRRSFEGTAVCAVRGGNVLGGGDWSEDRIIPDAVRAVLASAPITLRNPAARRPWQHVLCLLHGYLLGGAAALSTPALLAPAYNFGPGAGEELPVRELLDLFFAAWRRTEVTVEPSDLHEAGVLRIDSTLARASLGWQPAWGVEDTVRQTAHWYAAVHDGGEDAGAVTKGQIAAYRDLVRRAEAAG